MFWVYTVIPVKAELCTEWEAYFQLLQNVILTEEPGTIRFDLFRHREDPATYVVLETYKDETAFDLHLEAQVKRGVSQEVEKFLSGKLVFYKLDAAY